MPPKKLLAVLALMSPVALAHAADAAAQPTQPPLPPSQPPPQDQAPLQVPYQPQAQYQPQPQYQLARPRRRSYVEGDPIPVGYHVEDRPRQGLVISGFILLLVPYGISALSAIAAKGANETNWLYAPVAGPWFTMGMRQYGTCQRANTDDSLRCVADVFVVTGLIFDGVLQVTGAALLLAGYLNPKQELVRDERALRILPTKIGSGYGVGLGAAF